VTANESLTPMCETR